MATNKDRRRAQLIKLVGSPKAKRLTSGASIYYGQTKGGVKAALIVRRGDHIYRSKFSSLNEANAHGKLGWPLDTNTLWYIKEIHKAQIIMMHNASNGDTWISTPSDWNTKEKLLDPTNIVTDHRGYQIKHLSVEHMTKIECEVDLMTTRK